VTLGSNFAATNSLRGSRPGFFSSERKGQEEVYFTIQLTNARVSSIEHLLPDVAKSAGEVGSPPIEEIGFVFHTIKWTYVDGAITTEDTWSSQA